MQRGGSGPPGGAPARWHHAKGGRREVEVVSWAERSGRGQEPGGADLGVLAAEAVFGASPDEGASPTRSARAVPAHPLVLHPCIFHSPRERALFQVQ